jgi:uncharacterized protein involved in outer membrane biogenesis
VNARTDLSSPAAPWRARRRLWALGGLFAALVLGVVWGEASGWPFLRQPMENAATRATAVPVQMQGRVRVHLLWRPRLEVERLQIASDARFQAPHLLRAERVTLAWRWGDIWRWQRGDRLLLQRLQADVLDAHLMRVKNGDANWQLGDRDAAPTTEEAQDPLGGLPRFGSLVIGQGLVAWKDQLQGVDLA